MKAKAEFLIFLIFKDRMNFLVTCHGNTCSWKGQLEKTRSWKVQNEIGTIELGKFGPKLESSRRSWKVRAEVGKLALKLESLN